MLAMPNADIVITANLTFSNKPLPLTTSIVPWKPGGGWYFIASPMMEDQTPIADNGFITDDGTNPENLTYDLYRLNPSNMIWENFRNKTNHPDFTVHENGKGYLYANKKGTILSFSGHTIVGDSITTVKVSADWNLIGNPFNYNVNANREYYKMNNDHDGLVIVSDY